MPVAIPRQRVTTLHLAVLIGPGRVEIRRIPIGHIESVSETFAPPGCCHVYVLMRDTPLTVTETEAALCERLGWV